MITISHIRKSYEGQSVLEDLSLSLKEDGSYCLLGPSGRGKTTLLRLLAGLESPDEGTMEGFEGRRISMVFQEDRLFPEMNAVRNLQMTGIPPVEARALLLELLPEDSLSKPVSEFSGGMKRRAAVARAVGAESEVLLMDEPFTGLDEDTKARVIEFILNHRQHRLLLLSTHDEADAGRLGAEVIRL